MIKTDLESRVEALEADVSKFRELIGQITPTDEPWWKSIVGLYEDDPHFEAATRLGRDYRDSTKPRLRSPKKV